MNTPATSEEAAWLAGLFEGEGYVTCTPTGHIKVSVGMTDGDVLQRVEAILGGHLYGPQARNSKPGMKPMFVWTVGGIRNIEELFAFMRPYLGARRTEQFTGAIARWHAYPAKRRQVLD